MSACSHNRRLLLPFRFNGPGARKHVKSEREVYTKIVGGRGPRGEVLTPVPLLGCTLDHIKQLYETVL
jgi:hypothetical protein